MIGRRTLGTILSGLLQSAIVGIAGCQGLNGASSGAGMPKPDSTGRTQGSPWTILCLELDGPHRRTQVEQVAEALKQTPGIRRADVSIQQGDDGFTRLLYGIYYRKTDPGSGRLLVPESLRKDLEFIQQLGDPTAGSRYFLKARFVRYPQPDVGPPRWRLTQAKGLYSLQVAAFEPAEDFWEFKQAAADYCAWLRKKGYEAYYHHGPGCSIVTVGSFGESALIPVANQPPRYSAEINTLQEDPLLKYNLLNGKIVKARVADPADVALFPSAASPSVGGVAAKPAAVPSYSRLVPIPRQEP